MLESHCCCRGAFVSRKAHSLLCCLAAYVTVVVFLVTITVRLLQKWEQKTWSWLLKGKTQFWTGRFQQIQPMFNLSFIGWNCLVSPKKEYRYMWSVIFLLKSPCRTTILFLPTSMCSTPDISRCFRFLITSCILFVERCLNLFFRKNPKAWLECRLFLYIVFFFSRKHIRRCREGVEGSRVPASW